jgi:hypothetical protein
MVNESCSGDGDARHARPAAAQKPKTDTVFAASAWWGARPGDSRREALKGLSRTWAIFSAAARSALPRKNLNAVPLRRRPRLMNCEL